VKEFSLAVLSKDYFNRGAAAYFTGALAGGFGFYQTARLTAWVMGFPETWTVLEDSETPSSPK
jgi:hypothetical protein